MKNFFLKFFIVLTITTLTSFGFFINKNTHAQQLYCQQGYTLQGNLCVSNLPFLPSVAPTTTPPPSVLLNNSGSGEYSETGYTPLAQLPGLETLDFEADCPLADYINIVTEILIGIIVVICVVKLVLGGLEYITSESISGKANGKESIINGFAGLIIALSAYIVLNTINPTLLNLCPEIKNKSITAEEYQKQGRLGGGKCEEAISGPCSKSNLSSFSNPAQASAICNGESGNGKYLSSALDKGSDGNSFSFGLFQINIIAHGDKIGDGQICKNIFKVDPNPTGKQGNSVNDKTLGGCLKREDGICLKYAATVINQQRYNACKNFISQPSENIKYASQLQKKSGWGQWGFNKSCGF